MKHYSSLRAVCHAYANQLSQNGKSSSIYFEENKAYSYGSHYILAERKENTTFLNDLGYSSSTAKHINYMSNALWGNVIRLSNVYPKNVYTNLFNSLVSLKNAIKPEIYINNIERSLNYFYDFWTFENKSNNKFAEICGKDMFSTQDDVLYFDLINDIQEMFINSYDKNMIVKIKERQTAIQEIARKAKEEKEKFLHLKSIKEFLNYQKSSVYYKPENFVEILRISKDGNFVETSAGARVTVKSAMLLYSMIQAKKDIRGYDIDGYKVISINGTLKIGCHVINIKYVHKIGKQLINLTK